MSNYCLYIYKIRHLEILSDEVILPNKGKLADNRKCLKDNKTKYPQLIELAYHIRILAIKGIVPPQKKTEAPTLFINDPKEIDSKQKPFCIYE